MFRCAYLLGDLRALLGGTLVAAAAGSGVLLYKGLSILLSSLLRRWNFSVARSERPVKASEQRSKARYVQVLAPFCRFVVELGGGACRDSGTQRDGYPTSC